MKKGEHDVIEMRSEVMRMKEMVQQPHDEQLIVLFVGISCACGVRESYTRNEGTQNTQSHTVDQKLWKQKTKSKCERVFKVRQCTLDEVSPHRDS